MTLSATQLTLKLSPRDIYNLDNYFFVSDEQARAVETFCQTDAVNFLYLWGEQGTGKTHLLLAIAEQFQLAGHQAIYLSLEDLRRQCQPEILQSLEQTDLICLDDLDAIAGDADWQEAIFHCFNRLQLAGGKLLVAGLANPAHIELSLPDLRSRLATALIYQLPALSDQSKQHALMRQAQSRGLTMSDEVANYLLRHHGRDMPVLINLLKKLDKASLQEQRRLTVPFVKQVLADG
ncbi:DnaA regulatory inactivator Hda [Methylophaga lonarensis]|uniref:DnaA regulatory inactivator Hda n=1 Tax=Methylophaga lonarensis TaxID=999151 RepID=UPI003D2840EF